MNTIHFVMMGKGGVGKSLIAVTLAQYLRGTGLPLIASTWTRPVQLLNSLARWKLSISISQTAKVISTLPGSMCSWKRFWFQTRTGLSTQERLRFCPL
jgi:anion-transporting  ArsA/GET3 family ATPase